MVRLSAVIAPYKIRGLGCKAWAKEIEAMSSVCMKSINFLDIIDV
jgi:hypothetical protein